MPNAYMIGRESRAFREIVTMPPEVDRRSGRQLIISANVGADKAFGSQCFAANAKLKAQPPMPGHNHTLQSKL